MSDKSVLSTSGRVKLFILEQSPSTGKQVRFSNDVVRKRVEEIIGKSVIELCIISDSTFSTENIRCLLKHIIISIQIIIIYIQDQPVNSLMI